MVRVPKSMETPIFSDFGGWYAPEFLSFVTIVTLLQCYQLFLSYSYVKPCDVILPRLFYIFIHLPFTFSILWIEATQVCYFCSRKAHFKISSLPLNCGRRFSFLFAAESLMWERMWEKVGVQWESENSNICGFEEWCGAIAQRWKVHRFLSVFAVFGAFLRFFRVLSHRSRIPRSTREPIQFL